jgi:hypothetical protein
MKLRILKASVLSELRRSIENNLDLYRAGDFNGIVEDYCSYFECDLEIDQTLYGSLLPDNTNISEVTNCKIMLNVLGGLSPYMARDERLWTYLTHSNMLQYARSRWSIPEDDESAIKHIALHFFAKDKRGIERDNAASRLWWQATLFNRVKDIDLEESLKCLLHDTDVRASIIERPTTSQCINVFCAIIKKLHESYKSDKKLINRHSFRPLMKGLNLHGGYNDDPATRFRRKPPLSSDSKRQGVPIDSATPGRSVATLDF